MKKDKSTFIILILLAVIALIGYFFLGRTSDKSDKLKQLIVTTESGQKIQTEYSTIKKGKFFIKVPTQFVEMSKEDMKAIYQDDTLDKVYTSEDKLVNIIMNVTDKDIKDEDISSFRAEEVNNIEKSYSFNNFTFNPRPSDLKSEIREIDNHNVASIEYQDDTKYYHRLYFAYEGKLAIVSFICSLDIINEWHPVDTFIMDSLYFD